MPESNAAAGSPNWFANWLREGAQHAAESVTPPETARKHFREARIEFLRGIREIIDHRISHLSRDASKGTPVVVE